MDYFDRPALVLNADFRPLSYFPLSLIAWQDAVKAVYLGRVNVVSEYKEVARSASSSMRLPSVVSLKDYISLATTPTFNRFNLFLRDNFTCQFCLQRYPAKFLTMDHIVPKCRNGKTIWKNVVTACADCNAKKGSKGLQELEIENFEWPREPTYGELYSNGQFYPPKYVHESWKDYLLWDEDAG